MADKRKSYPSDVSDEEWGFCVRYLTLMTENAPQRDHPSPFSQHARSSFAKKSRSLFPDADRTIESARTSECSRKYFRLLLLHGCCLRTVCLQSAAKIQNERT